MVMSKKFLILNLAIVVLNATIGVVLNLATFSGPVGIRERFVVLNADEMDGQDQNPDYLTEDVPINGTDPDEVLGCPKASEPRHMPFDPSRGLLDKSRVFQTFPFHVAAENWSNVTSTWKVCMSVQASADLLFWVSKQVETWTGPISVAVFTPDADYAVAIRMIRYLKACNPDIRSRVSFHISYPKNLPPKYVYSENEATKEYNCDAPEMVNKELVRELRSARLADTIRKSRYPQNLLRNVAREGCPSDFAFTPDVDMLSIPHMAEDLNEFLSSSKDAECQKCAFVIPTYEIHTKVSENPTNKTELNELIRRRRAQRFHVKAFAPNQANSNLARWEAAKITPKLQVLYNISTWRNYWEPIYVTKANVPPFDERFVGYGFTRNSQVYEMHVADYTWHMLSNAFLCHRGFQTTKHSSIRKAQIRENSKRYKTFRKELYARYGKNETDYEPKPTAKKKKVYTKTKTKKDLPKEKLKKTGGGNVKESAAGAKEDSQGKGDGKT